jgi:hypothetical protein
MFFGCYLCRAAQITVEPVEFSEIIGINSFFSFSLMTSEKNPVDATPIISSPSIFLVRLLVPYDPMIISDLLSISCMKAVLISRSWNLLNAWV